MKFFRALISIAFSVMGVLILYSFCKENNIVSVKVPPKDLYGSGQFFAGLVGCLFSLSGFILLYETLKSQNQSFKIQQFQSNFYELIKLHHDILNRIKCNVEGITPNGEEVSGSDFFAHLAERISIDFYGIDRTYYSGDTIESFKDFNHLHGTKRLIKLYEHYFHIYQSYLGHYFRNLYHFVNYIDESDVPDKEKYAKILRAQLSNYEILLLAYNGMYKYGEKFKVLIEKYKLLDNLNLEIGLSGGYSKRIVNIYILTNAYPHLHNTEQEQANVPPRIKLKVKKSLVEIKQNRKLNINNFIITCKIYKKTKIAV